MFEGGDLNKADILRELTVLAEADKAPAQAAEWIGDDIGRTRSVTVPLAINDVVRHGLRLYMAGPRSVPTGREFFGMGAHLFATLDGDHWHLGRIEFDPAGPPPHHLNTMRDRTLLPRIEGPHYHPFAANAKIGLEALTPDGNLPVALPEDKQFWRYDDVLETVSGRFKISGFWTEDPRWLLLLA